METTLSWRRFADAFDRFFFAKVDSRSAGLLRIGFALLILAQNLAVAPKLFMFFSEHGVLSLGAARSITDFWAWTLFSALPTNDTVLVSMFVLYNLAAVLLLLGFRTRYLAPIVYVFLLSFDHRNRLILDGQDGMLRTIGFMLLFLPLDASFAWERKPRATTMSAWPLRVLQIQMCLFFLGAACWKLKGGEWLDGTTLYYVARLENFFGNLPFPRFLFSWMPLVQVMTWGSLALELGAPFLIWFRETRRLTLLGLLAFHLGVHCLMNLLVFHLVMLLGWSAFLSESEWAQAEAGLRYCAARLGWKGSTRTAPPRLPMKKAS